MMSDLRLQIGRLGVVVSEECDSRCGSRRISRERSSVSGLRKCRICPNREACGTCALRCTGSGSVRVWSACVRERVGEKERGREGERKREREGERKREREKERKRGRERERKREKEKERKRERVSV